VSAKIKRREFITLVGGAAVAWPLAARGQQTRAPRVGALVLGNPNPEVFWRTFREGMRDLGYIEGHSILFEFRSAGGKANLLSDLAAELVGLKVDVIVAFQTLAATAAKQATNDIPIVMSPAGDPVGTGLVASLARPGGNVTGLAGIAAELSGKSVELIRELLPSARRVAVLATANNPFTKPFLEQCRLAGRTLGIEIQTILIARAEELDAAFATMIDGQADAVIVQASLPQKPTIDLALKHRLPAVSPNDAFVAGGGLLSYSANLKDLFRKAAGYVDKILKGSKPADLPVEQPTKFELTINLKTAKAIGLEIPPTLLARADEVIE
jgi:putative tryptophan/tyrosine transport system substrate-binding protein